jgi:asparagine synthase (glutamine-hydrolysing)
MSIFGFVGRFAGLLGVDALVDYGNAIADSRAPAISSVRHDYLCACWTARSATDGGLAVALQGQTVSIDALANHGDTQAAAILDAYRRVGVRCLDSLRGRFALAIIDTAARRAVLAVDPMGIERLTFTVRGGGLVFSSSAEAVARFPAVGASLRAQSLFDYLLLHMVPAPDTVFEGVQKLRPGTFAIFENGQVRVERYWRPRFGEHNKKSVDELGAALFASLRTAVKACEPDDRTGAFLSGGLDSSTIAGLLSEVSPRPAKTFSIGFGYPEYDELAYARIANARFGCEAHEYVVRGSDIVEMFPRIARAYDEPFGNSSALPVYYCARLARENGVEHLLAGDGGDELFAGNSRYAEQRVFERYQMAPAFLRRQMLEPLLAVWPAPLTFWPIRRAIGYVQKANIPLPARLETWNIVNQVGHAELLHPDFLAAIDPQAPLARMQEVWDSTPSDSILDRMLYYDWHYTLADNDLRKVETMSALAGVRVSYPMLHSDVVEVSTRVPPHIKMPGARLRDFYKRAMQGFLPDEIIRKKKHGFGLPFGFWLQDSPDLRDIIFGNLSSLRARRIVRAEFIDRLLDLHRNDDARHYGVFLWVLAMLEQWLHEHTVARPPELEIAPHR